jgi:hypothetical protein
MVKDHVPDTVSSSSYDMHVSSSSYDMVKDHVNAVLLSNAYNPDSQKSVNPSRLTDTVSSSSYDMHVSSSSYDMHVSSSS